MTFFESGTLGSPAAWAAAAAIGAAFGFWLERAGFGSSRRLAGIFYLQDFAVVQVMFTAVVTALLALGLLSVTGLADLGALHRIETSYGPQILGGAIFGAGFVLGGWCPGTALVGAASGKLDAVAFLVAAGAGSLVYAGAFDALAPLRDVGVCGAVSLPEVLGVRPGLLTVGVVAMAVAMFALISRAGHRSGAAESVVSKEEVK